MNNDMTFVLLRSRSLGPSKSTKIYTPMYKECTQRIIIHQKDYQLFVDPNLA